MVEKKVPLLVLTAISCFLTLSFLTITLTARAETDIILAEIGERTITLKDFENKVLEVQNNVTGSAFDRDRDKESLLMEMVSLELFAQEALALGLDQDDLVKERIIALQQDRLSTSPSGQDQEVFKKANKKVVERYVLATEYLKREMQQSINIDEVELQEYYKKNKENFIEPEKIKARQIFISAKTEDEKKDAKIQADKLFKRIKNGEDFLTLVAEFSEDALSKDISRDMRYFTRGALVPELVDPVFQLKQGEVSPVLKSKGGFHIFKLEDRKERRALEYHEAQDRIMKTLKTDKQKKLYKALEEKLFKKYKVKIYKDRIPSTPLS